MGVVRIPKNMTVWELRGKGGVIIFQYFHSDYSGSWSWNPRERIIGPVRWYSRRRGERWRPRTDWLSYW